MRLDPITSPAPSLDEFEVGATANAVEVDGTADLDRLGAIAPHLSRIDIRFTSFKDGRGFSIASLLRGRIGFSGELRAVGDLLPDQAGFLSRVGFDAVQPDTLGDPRSWRRSLNAFSHVYQPAADRRPAAYAVRHHAEPSGRPATASTLNARYADAEARDVLHEVLTSEFAGRVAVLSSFGAEAAVLLHLVASVDPATPVLFLNTDRHFAQTLQHRDDLVRRLGLTNVRDLTPVAAEAATQDPDGDLWKRDPDACCALRKVRPLSDATAGFDALISGRKRFHGGARLQLPRFEKVESTMRINPLVNWNADAVEEYRIKHHLPLHPMTDMGYRSIGCWPCTAPTSKADDPRSGRWQDLEKTECGIHAPAARAPLEKATV